MGRNLFDVDDRLLLMWAVCHKDRRALAILYLKYAPQVRAYIASHIDSVADTEDLVQDVFLQVCRGKGHYDSVKGVKPYILGIARNLIRRCHCEKETSPQAIAADSLNGFSLKCRIRARTGAARQVSTR